MRRSQSNFDYDDFRDVRRSSKRTIAATLFDFFYPLLIGVCIICLACALGYVDRRDLAVDAPFKAFVERWI